MSPDAENHESQQPPQQPVSQPQPSQQNIGPDPIYPPASPSLTPGQNATEPSIPPEPATPKRSKKWLLLSILLIVLALGAAAYALHATQHKPVAAKKSTTSTQAPVSCSSETCFAQPFKNCSPAILAASSPIADVKYQIYGSKNNGCSMSFEYTSNPNPAWVNKPMTCNFDNTKGLDDSVSAVFNDLSAKKNSYSCSGPLVTVLQNP